MRFFEQQENARAETTRLLVLFALTVLALVLAVNFALALTWRLVAPGSSAYPQYFFTVNTVMTGASTPRQTNAGAVAEVDLTLPSATQNASYEFCCLAAFVFKIVAAGGDLIYWGQVVPAGGTHVTTSEVNDVIRLICFTNGQWTVASHEGQWSIG